uniref:Uncharacterized protein n=1 Tax=Romanomermis culicivorax TaxID=13658 RepID=A0A915HZT5_ROMCU
MSPVTIIHPNTQIIGGANNILGLLKFASPSRTKTGRAARGQWAPIYKWCLVGNEEQWQWKQTMSSSRVLGEENENLK